MNMQPVAHIFTYKDGEGREFHTYEPIKGVPVRVQHLYNADQMAMAQEAIKIEAAMVVQHALNGNIYAARIRQIEITK